MYITLHPKERIYFALMTVLSFVAYGVLGFVACSTILSPEVKGIVLFYTLFFIALRFFISCLLVGHIKGNALKVTPHQFPDIYTLLKEHSEKLDLKQVPAMYILQGGGLLNAFATKFAGRDFVVVYSDVLETAYQEGIDAVSFIIGHELGHIKRDHVGFTKSLLILPAQIIPFLGKAYSRACEYTCDTVGSALCPEGAAQGILILAAGKRLYKRVDVEAWTASGTADRGFAMWIAHIFATHPPLVHRIAHINQQNQDHLLSDRPPFVSPQVDAEKHVQR